MEKTAGVGRAQNGRFTAGNSGRPKGSINKTTREIREFLTQFLNDNLETIQSDFDTLEPKERIKLMMELVKFILPSVKAESMDNYKTTEERWAFD